MLLATPAEKAQYDLLLASYMNGKTVKKTEAIEVYCTHKGERIRNVEIVLE